jgi:hypothetical protein
MYKHITESAWKQGAVEPGSSPVYQCENGKPHNEIGKEFVSLLKSLDFQYKIQASPSYTLDSTSIKIHHFRKGIPKPATLVHRYRTGLQISSIP